MKGQKMEDKAKEKEKPEAEEKKSKEKHSSGSNKCNDIRCPVHGKIRFRGRTFTGKVTAARMQRTAVIESGRRHLIQKYQRYEKRKTVIKAHNPDCIAAKAGDTVKIAECRPLSKTKKFVIIEKLG